MKRILVLLLVILPLLSVAHADDVSTAASTAPSVLVKTVAVPVREVSASLTVFGSVEAAPQKAVTLAAPRESRIADVEVSNGESVRKGAILLVLKPTPGSSSAFVQAQSAAAYATTALAHTRDLYKEHLATRDQLAAAQKSFNDARIELENAKRAGGAGALRMRAPANGVVTGLMVNVGQQVAANTALLHLALQGGLTVRVGVVPEKAADIRVGARVTLQDVYNARLRIHGRVSNVSEAVNGNTGLTDVFVHIPAHAEKMMPGTYVQGDIVLRQVSGPAVPRSAVLRDAGQSYVFIVRHDIAHRVNVKVLANDGTWIAVKGDIRAGAKVVTLGNYELSDGARTRTAAH